MARSRIVPFGFPQVTLALAVAVVVALPVPVRSAERGPIRIVVAPDGSGDYRTVDQALRRSRDGDRIVLRPGEHAGGFAVRKAVTIIGAPDHASIIVAAEAGPATRVRSADAVLRGLAFRMGGTTLDPAISVEIGPATIEGCSIDAPTGISIAAGASATVAGCEIASRGQSAVVITGPAPASTIRDSHLTGGSTAIRVEGGASPLVEGNVIDGAESGVWVTGPGPAPTVRGNEITAGNGVFISGAEALIEGNKITSTGHAGVVVGGPSPSGTLRDNAIGGGEVGIDIGQAASPLVEGNTISGSSAVGIAIVGEGSAPTISANSVSGGSSGIEAVQGADPVIEGNTVAGHTDAGIFVEGESTVPSVRGNTVTGGQWAISVGGGADPEIRDNHIQATPEPGVEMAGIDLWGEGTAPIVSGNVVSAGTWGIQASSGADPVIEGNTVAGHTTTGIFAGGDGTAPIVRGNTITGGEWGIVVGEGADGEFVDNSVQGEVDPESQMAGMDIWGEGTAPLVSGNTVTGGGWGIQAREGADPTIQGNTLTDQARTGVWIGGAGTAAVLRDNSISGGDFGVWIDTGAGGEVTGNRISGLVGPDADSSGIDILGEGSAPVVSGNTITGGGWGIEVKEGADPVVEGNTVTDPAQTGIYVGDDGSAPLVEGNVLSGGEWGIAVAEGADGEIRDNHIQGDTGPDANMAGIDVSGEGSEPLVAGNTVTGGGWGIQVGSGADPVIEGNTVTDPRFTGITLSGEGTAPVVRSNTLSGGSWGISVADGADPLLAWNAIKGPEYTAISASGQDTVVTVTGNALSGARWGIVLEDGASGEVSANSISGGDVGIDITKTAPDVLRNTIREAGTGILIADDADPTVRGNRISGSDTAIAVTGAGTSPVIGGNVLRDNEQDIDVDAQAEPVLEPTPSPRPTPSPTPSPSPRPTPTATPSPSPGPTATPSPTPSPSPSPRPTATPSPTPSPSPSPRPTATPSPTPSPGLSAAVEAIVEEVETKVADVRGLDWRSEVPVRLVDPDQAVTEALAELDPDQPAEIRADGVMLARIGLLPPGTDLLDVQAEATRTGIAGYYRTTAGDISLIDGDGQLSAEERLVLAHEVTHGLQDQAFDLDAFADTAREGDQARAREAVPEGDAMLVMMAMGMTDTLAGVTELIEPVQDTIVEDRGIVPDSLLLGREGTFAYLDGMRFVEWAHRRGGWPAVDDLYARPPSSTEQVLHPELYPHEQPVELRLPDLATVLGPGWRTSFESTMGELRVGVFVADDDTVELPLAPFMPSRLPNHEAAAGWGGDRIASLDGPGTAWAVVWQSTWDSPSDADEFAAAARAAIADLPGATVVLDDTSVAEVRRAGRDVLVLAADGEETLSHVQERLEVG